MSAPAPKKKFSAPKKKRKNKKTPATIKIIGPRSAYIHFSQEFWPTLQKKHPGWTFGQMTKEVSSQWNKIKNDPNKSQKYRDLAAQDMARYKAEKALAAQSPAASSSSANAAPKSPVYSSQSSNASSSSAAAAPQLPASSSSAISVLGKTVDVEPWYPNVQEAVWLMDVMQTYAASEYKKFKAKFHPFKQKTQGILNLADLYWNLGSKLINLIKLPTSERYVVKLMTLNNTQAYYPRSLIQSIHYEIGDIVRIRHDIHSRFKLKGYYGHHASTTMWSAYVETKNWSYHQDDIGLYGIVCDVVYKNKEFPKTYPLVRVLTDDRRRSRYWPIQFLEKMTLSGAQRSNLTNTAFKLISVASVVIRQLTQTYDGELIRVSDGAQKIADQAFLNQDRIDIILPDTINDIGQSAFENTKLVKFKIPPLVTSINEAVFSGCQYMRHITIPSNVKKIERSAFNHCDRLREIDLFVGLEEIHLLAFSFCDNLEIINIPPDMDVTKVIGWSGAFRMFSDRITIVIKGRTSIPKADLQDYNYLRNGALVIMDGINILANQFKANQDIRSVSAGTTNTNAGGITIGSRAFQKCANLETLDVRGVERIGHDAFGNCTKLHTVRLSDVKNILDGAFYDCVKLTSVQISAKEIGSAAFKRCGSLKTLDLRGVEKIGSFAFDSCTSLTEVTFDKSLKFIGSYPFTWCRALKKVNVPHNFDTRAVTGWPLILTAKLVRLPQPGGGAASSSSAGAASSSSAGAASSSSGLPKTPFPNHPRAQKIVQKFGLKLVFQAIMMSVGLTNSSTGKSYNWKQIEFDFKEALQKYNIFRDIDDFDLNYDFNSTKLYIANLQKKNATIQANKQRIYNSIMRELNAPAASAQGASSSAASAPAWNMLWTSVSISSLTDLVRVQAFWPESVSWHKGTLQPGGRVEFDDGDIKQYKIWTDGEKFKHKSPGSQDGELQLLFQDAKTPYVLLGNSPGLAFNTIFGTPDASGKMQASSLNMSLYTENGKWVLRDSGNIQKFTKRGHETEPPHIGWTYNDSPCVIIRNQGADKAIPSLKEWLSGIIFQCDIQNDLNGTSSPEWVTYGPVEQDKFRKLLENYIFNEGPQASDMFKIGSGEYKIDLKERYQERSNIGANSRSGYKRPIRVVNPREKAFKAPQVAFWKTFNAIYPTFPLVRGGIGFSSSQRLFGIDAVSTNGQEPDVMMTGWPECMGTVNQAQIQKYFDWKAKTKFIIPRGYTFVNYYAFKDASDSLQRMLQFCGNRTSIYGEDVRCSVMYHAPGGVFENLASIKAGGFRNMGSHTGSMAGKGTYFAVHPYTDYCAGNSLGAHYCSYDSRGYTALFVCAGAVVPSEYTYDVSGHSRIAKPGSGGTVRVNGTDKNTRNRNAICGGNFDKDLVNRNGTIPKRHREVVFWFDSLRFTTILGICILKRS